MVGNVTVRTGLPPVEEVENEPAVVAILQECAEDDESSDEAVVAAARFLTCVSDACGERFVPSPALSVHTAWCGYGSQGAVCARRCEGAWRVCDVALGGDSV